MDTPPTEQQQTIVLITGYARAGKDTFADGMTAAVRRRVALKRSFAEALKNSANFYLENLNLFKEDDQDFWSDSFKAKHRNVLVTLGEFARSLDKDVFIKALFQSIKDFRYPITVVIPDCRYLNEILIPRQMLPEARIVTVRLTTIGVLPANEEEALSIAEIQREMPFDYEYTFKPNNRQAVAAEGANLARHLNL